MHFHLGSRTTPGRPGIRGQPGYLTILLYKIKTRKWELLSLADPYATEQFRFDIGDAKVDMKVGKISIRGAKNEIAEHLALTFCVSLLHVFLQPRPADWEPGESLEPKVNRRGATPIRHIKAEKLALVVAAGLLIATPSNHFFRKKMKERSNGFGEGGFGRSHDEYKREDSTKNEADGGAMFGGGRGNDQDEGATTEDIVTQLMGGDQAENNDNGGNTLFDDLYGADDYGTNDHRREDEGTTHDEEADTDFFGNDNINNDNDQGFHMFMLSSTTTQTPTFR